MPDRVIAGEAPGANASAQPPGTVWMEVIELASDATHKTVKVNVYSTNQARYIGYAPAGPGYDQPGGPFTAILPVPALWETPPSGNTPGKVQTANTVIPNPGFYRFEAQCAAVRIGVTCQVGTPDAKQLGPYYSADAIVDNTYLGRQARMRDEVKDMARPTPIVGASTSGRLKPIRTKSGK